MATVAKMTTMEEPTDRAPGPTGLGSSVAVTELWDTSPARFRLEFTNDARSKEMRWVLFTATKRGCVGKLIFTLEKDASAHVKSITVNPEFRGLGLARMLYLATLSTLAELSVQALHLEAEEDSKRHGKLVGLYETWGFQTKLDAKVLFLYNNNECFRKVPMMRSFEPRQQVFFPARPQTQSWFCMLSLQMPDGTCLLASEDGELHVCKRTGKAVDSMWQTLLGAQGEIFLRSVHGKFLCVEEDGKILADRPLNSTWETFQVVPQHNGGGGVALKNFHGGYLCIDPEANEVVSSAEPVAWDAGDIMSLVCNSTSEADESKATPSLFMRIMRKYQTRAFVQQQMAKYGDFQHAALSVADACKMLLELAGDHELELAESWLLKYMLATAEAVREDGHPDWFQLAVFLRALGLLFLGWTDDNNAVLRSIAPREWLEENRTWVVGEPIPETLPFPELNALNANHNAPSTKQPAGEELGMDNATLPWTPDEYLFRVLMHNKTSLPAEALQSIRFWSLQSWYQQDHYNHLCTRQDLDTKEWLQTMCSYSSISDDAVNAVEPEKLLPYYLGVADKYLPAVLQW